MASVFDLYGQLNAEQRDFIQERRLQGSREPAGWLDFFGDLATFDARADRIRRLAYIGSFCLLLALVIANLVRFAGNAEEDISFSLFLPCFVGFLPCFLGVALGAYWLTFAVISGVNLFHLYAYLANVPGFSALDLAISIVVLLVALAAFVAASKLAKVDVANELRELIYPFLRLLHEDMEKGEEVALALDTSGKWREQGGALIIDKPWCTGGAKLADGTDVSWALSEELLGRKFLSKIEILLRIRGKIYQVSEFDDLRAAVWVRKKKNEVRGPDIESNIDAIRQRYASSKEARRSILVEKVRVRSRPGERRHLVKATRTMKGRKGRRPPIKPQDLAELLAEAYGRVERSE